LEENDIDTLSWPARSPDLNIIEHIWGFVKDYIQKHRKDADSKEKVWKYAKEAFFSDGARDLGRRAINTYQ